MSDLRFSDLAPVDGGYYWLRRRPSENLASRTVAYEPAELVRIAKKNKLLHVFLAAKVRPLSSIEFVGALWSEEVGADGAR